jgi:hypothetical protein
MHEGDVLTRRGRRDAHSPVCVEPRGGSTCEAKGPRPAPLFASLRRRKASRADRTAR